MNEILLTSRAAQVLPKKRRRDAAGCMIIRGNEVLLLQRGHLGTAPHTWAFPGGRLDRGETPLGAALRETKEETSIDLSRTKPEQVFVTPLIYDGIGVFTTFVFRFPLHTIFSVCLDQESENWEWLRRDEILTNSDTHDFHAGIFSVVEHVWF
jgi:8-oxo-dGTP pyrophosphatase MutT (NUDIX family)